MGGNIRLELVAALNRNTQGAEPQRSGDVAAVLGVKVQAVAPLRDSLMKKGMIYSPAHGDTAFTVPLFDTFMKRAMPQLPTKGGKA
jgi:hypothetical protein